MLQSLRDAMAKKPWIGWVLALLLGVLSVVIYLMRTKSDSPYSPESMRETLTIRFTDTNEEVKIPRGQLDKELRRRGDVLDPSQGIINPKTGQPTGFLVDDDAWKSMIERINKEKAEIRASIGKTIKSAPRQEKPLTPEMLEKLGEGIKPPEKK